MKYYISRMAQTYNRLIPVIFCLVDVRTNLAKCMSESSLWMSPPTFYHYLHHCSLADPGLGLRGFAYILLHRESNVSFCQPVCSIYSKTVLLLYVWIENMTWTLKFLVRASWGLNQGRPVNVGSHNFLPYFWFTMLTESRCISWPARVFSHLTTSYIISLNWDCIGNTPNKT